MKTGRPPRARTRMTVAPDANVPVSGSNVGGAPEREVHAARHDGGVKAQAVGVLGVAAGVDDRDISTEQRKERTLERGEQLIGFAPGFGEELAARLADSPQS